MSESPIRRGQLIVPFGVGSLYVGKDGVGMISAGLDHWYKKHDTNQLTEDIDEFRFNEWRLEKRLKVNHFRRPPDYRIKKNKYEKLSEPNSYLTIPYLRFPTWHFCQYCRVLQKFGLHQQGHIECKSKTCKDKKFNNQLIQVPLVVVCQNGHIDDFPWREWCHGEASPNCHKTMKLIATGNPGLDGQFVKCECGKSRSLGAVLTEGNKVKENDKTITEYLLSKNLDQNNLYLCQGKELWNGSEDQKSCGLHLKGSLRSSNNIYFALHEKSIRVPSIDLDIPEGLLSLMNGKLRQTIKLMNRHGLLNPENLRSEAFEDLEEFSDEQIENSFKKILNVKDVNEEDKDDNQEEFHESEEKFKWPEYKLFLNNHDSSEVRVINYKAEKYNSKFHKYFNSIGIVKKLIETKALYGFTRIDMRSDLRVRDHKNMLRKERLSFSDSWLPAIENSGEGIFIEFNLDAVKEFENRSFVQERVKLFQSFSRDIEVNLYKSSARYMLLHSFSHVLMNTLIYECGYGASSLQERIYCSNDPKNEMAGILIYTAATDSEGTMGGLVRNGLPGNFERIIISALKTSQWCSTDPVCYEIAESGGQGPHSLNMSACHNCTLVPETSCDGSFNCYLDRTLLMGKVDNESLGYFSL